jgi:hypothetical protein
MTTIGDHDRLLTVQHPVQRVVPPAHRKRHAHAGYVIPVFVQSGLWIGL